MKVNVGWLEPLLDQLKRNRNQVIQPFIDGIDMKTLEFASPGIYYRGAFSWDLRYARPLQLSSVQYKSVSSGVVASWVK